MVSMGNRPFRKAFCFPLSRIPFEKILRGNPHCSFSVTFRRFPFWFAENAADITASVSDSPITNPGSVYAEPVMTVYGGGDIALMVGLTIIAPEGISGITVRSSWRYL